MSEWKECKLGDVCEFQEGYVNPSQNFSEYFDGNIKWLRATDLNNGNVYNTSRTLTEKGFLSAGKSAKLFKPNTIGISKSGTIGRLGILKDYMCGNRAVINIAPSEKVNTQFIYYNLLNRQDQFEHLAVGSVQKNLYVPILAELKIKLPSLSTQNEIAKKLSALDDKIELNNQINRNLEEQAQAIFKNWFIDFEPFGGEMPEDWQTGKLSDIAEYEKDKIDVAKLNAETYYSTENMLPNKAGVSKAASLPTTEQTTRCIPGETIISNIRPYFKKIFYCTEEIAGCSTDVLCFKPKKESFSIYNYCLLYSDSFFDYMVKGSKGTKMPRGDKSQIMNYNVVIPTESVISDFNTVVSNILQQISNNKKENECLAKLRDTLLPDLMSGEFSLST